MPVNSPGGSFLRAMTAVDVAAHWSGILNDTAPQTSSECDAAVALPQPKTILVVEDNHLNSRLLEVRLGIHGYAVLTTPSGMASLNIAREQKPDLILMDIQLPDISGIEAIRRLRADEETRAIPVIVVTAFVMASEKASIVASGCEAFVGKPFDGDELVNLIERHTQPPLTC